MQSRAHCQLPSTKHRLTMQDVKTIFSSLPASYWPKAFFIAVGAALLIGLPTVLIPNPIFTRMIPTRPLDYVFFALASLFIGLTWALPQHRVKNIGQRQTLLGYITAFFAVGCPTCNKIVLFLLGSGGAMHYFAPVQPWLGAASIALIVLALHRRLQTLAGIKRNTSAAEIPHIPL